MITALTRDEIVTLITTNPEQKVVDWKSDFTVPNDNDKRGEVIKDIVAVANASPLSHGFIVYGVDPRRPDPILGISSGYDDAKLQQLLLGKVEPAPEFLYYEVPTGTKKVAVIQVTPSKPRPFIIITDIGKMRAGQIPIRRGSSTEGARLSDLLEFFCSDTSVYFRNAIQRRQQDIAAYQAWLTALQVCDQGAEQARRYMDEVTGLRRR